MAKKIDISYSPELTAAMFHKDQSYIRAIRGPVGAGKTVALVMEILRLALAQEADTEQLVYPYKHGRPVRPSRWLFVRATYPQLKSTLIKTFNEWMGKLGRMVYDSPIRWHAEVPLPDGTIADIECIFMALDGDRAEENLRSLEVTGIAISEYSEISEGVLTIAKTRTGRYPKAKTEPVISADGTQAVGPDGMLMNKTLFGATRPCIILESNSPSTRSHWYRIFEVDRPRGHRMFAQPPALLYDVESEVYHPNPEAENIRNLRKGFDYYFDIVNGSSKDYIDVYVMNQYGATFDGKPVYPSFNSAIHMLGGLNPPTWEDMNDPWVPERHRLLVGMDFGLNPAAAIGQDGAMGQVTIYDEVTAEGILFEEFLNDMLLPVLNTRFRGMPVQVIGDPANDVRNSLARVNAYGMLRERGIPVMAAPTNDIAFRLESVNHFLQRTSMFRLHPRCTVLREAFAGGYHFQEVRGKNGVYKDTPDKGEFSHVSNAVEYLCSHLYYGVRKQMKRRSQTARSSSTDPDSRSRGFTYV